MLHGDYGEGKEMESRVGLSAFRMSNSEPNFEIGNLQYEIPSEARTWRS